MGQTKSKTDIVIPVSSIHDGNTNFTSHHVHSDTLKMAVGAFVVMILVMALTYMLCKKFVGRFGAHAGSDHTVVRYIEKPREILPKIV